MSEAQDREDVTAGAEEEVAEGNGSGGTLFKRAFSGKPEDRGVRTLLYGSVGAVVALVLTGLGVRKWRRRS